MAADAGAPYLQGAGGAGLWVAIFAAPVAWFLALGIAYALPFWACETGRRWPLHLLYVVALAVSGAGLLAALRIRRATAAGEPAEAADPLQRTRFMATVGVLGSVLFSLVTLAQWIATFVIGPCQPTPRLRDSPDVLAPPAVVSPERPA
ncbi:MAG: hypothetical protein IRZ00_12690 [Gemmatimonadetes bacterium]|nr:hypothetical protein [Gemmatimonadota bacterium]